MADSVSSHWSDVVACFVAAVAAAVVVVVVVVVVAAVLEAAGIPAWRHGQPPSGPLAVYGGQDGDGGEGLVTAGAAGDDAAGDAAYARAAGTPDHRVTAPRSPPYHWPRDLPRRRPCTCRATAAARS